MHLFATALLSLSTLAAPASAQDASAAATAGKTPATPAAKPEKVCRRIDTTGSIMSTRVCHTRAEWAQIDGQNAQDADQTLSRRNNTLGGPR